MAEAGNVSYVNVGSYTSVPVVKLQSDAFLELMKKFGVGMLYVKESKTENGAKVSEFMFFHEGLMHVCNGYGYKTLVDSAKGSSLGFDGSSSKYSEARGEANAAERAYSDQHSSDGEIFYFAMDLGYKDFKEFDDAVSKDFTKDKAEEYRFAMGKGLKDKDAYVRYKGFIESMTNAGFKD